MEETRLFDKNSIGSVLGITLASFCSCFMFVTSARWNEPVKYLELGPIIMLLLCVVSVAGYIFLFSSIFGKMILHSDVIEVRITRMKLNFLYLFGIGSALNQLIVCTYHFLCLDDNMFSKNMKLMCNILLCIFIMTQTGFIATTVNRKLQYKICVFILLSVFIVTNLAIWTHFTVLGSIEHAWLSTKDRNRTCKAGSNNAQRLYFSTRLVFEPIVLEFALLSSLFIVKLWSNIERQNTGLKERHDNNQHMESCGSRKSTLLSAIVSVVIIGPRVVTKIVATAAKSDSFAFGTLICFCMSNTILLLLILKCFHYALYDCYHGYYQATNIGNHSTNNFMLLVGSSGYVIFITLSLYNNINRNDTVDDKIRYFALYFEITCIVIVLLQNILILQLVKFQRVVRVDPSVNFSVEALGFTIGLLNLGFWAENSFITEKYGMLASHEAQFYGKYAYKTMFHIFYPFGIFYHFECFIFFYEIYVKYTCIRIM